jgi:hypothetical protein
MTDDEALARLLRSVVRPVPAVPPARDLWPLVVSRSQARVRWSWLDFGLVLAVAVALVLLPNWRWLVLYHL